MEAAKQIEQIAIDRANEDIADVIGRYIKITKRGHEYVACCPFHEEKSPSFTISPAKGFYYCFGCGASGDAVGFVKDYEGISFPAAVERINGSLPSPENAKSTAKKIQKPSEWMQICPVPDDAPDPDFAHFRLGSPVSIWDYFDSDGALIGYVARFDLNENGKISKETLPLCYAVNIDTGKKRWRWKAFEAPRPLFGLEQLTARPESKVMVCEGEKATIASRSIFQSFVSVSWPGGCGSVDRADFGVLAGRSVTLWPDWDWKPYKDNHPMAGKIMPLAEQPGVVAMRAVYEAIKDIAKEVRIVPPMNDSPNGWDLADPAPCDGFYPREYAKINVRQASKWFASIEQKPEGEPSAQDAADDGMPAGESISDFIDIRGRSADAHYWIFDRRRRTMRSMKSSELTRKATLIELAPSSAWDTAIAATIGDGRKFTGDAAFEYIVKICSGLPVYVLPETECKKQPRRRLTGKHAADSASIAEEIQGRTLFDEYSQSWYGWEVIWRPITIGEVERILVDVMDEAFDRQYDNSAFTGTFSMMKKRLGRSPQLNADGSAAYDTWNREKHLLPMRNGVLDIRTGDLLPHSPGLMMPWMLPHDYDQDATCPVTEDFMRQLSQGDKATETVLYCFLAALLHGRADLQKYLECIGLAGTGKSTYIRLCTALVGDANVAITTMKQLHENRFETANIYGKRLVVISDADKYGGSVDVFKAITGEDPIRYEEKNKQPGKPFIFGGMVIVAGNQPIQFNDNSTAMVRRRIPIHLDARLDKSRVDIALSDKMQAEMPGLVNKLLSYTQADIASALKDTQQRRAMAERRSMCETNPIAAWINEMLIQDLTGKAQVGLSSNNASDCLYPNYAKYCDDTGRKGIVGLQSFSRSVLDILGYVGIQAEKKREGSGTYIYGVRLRGVYDDGIPSMMVSDTY